MKEECLICKTPFEYLETDELMECAICHKKENSKTRCCKRDSYLSILSAINFTKEKFGVEMEKPDIVCDYSNKNNQCIGKRCPFHKTNTHIL